MKDYVFLLHISNLIPSFIMTKRSYFYYSHAFLCVLVLCPCLCRYLEICHRDGTVVGARMSKYLLEKARVVKQAPKESTFHVLNYLLVGAPRALRESLKLTESASYM